MGVLKNTRVGETNINNQGELMTIIKYNGANDLYVKFEKTNKIKKGSYKEFKNGHLSDNYYPSVFGVGYIGDTTVSEGNRKVKASYRTWANIVSRCYNKKYQDKRPTYIGCSMCEEWLCYANFEKWYNENYYQIEESRMELDKDILKKGNKIYSPETCVFVPQRINTLFTKRNNNRGKYPIGVTYSKKGKKFAPQVQGYKWLGYYNTVEEAFEVYKVNKEKLIKKIADEFKDKIPTRLYEALYSYEVEITD